MEIVVESGGFLAWDGRRSRCALGRAGLKVDKREGDGATPVGRFALGRVYYRPDRVSEPATGLGTEALTPAHGWCDDPGHRDYNRPVRLPHPARCEEMWRTDGLYDVVVTLGHNDDPVVPGMGSAIFLHVAAPGLAPTEGCVALPLAELLDLLKACRPGDALVVEAQVA